MTADLRRLIADDAFAGSFQTVGQYRAALLAAAAQVLPDPEPTTAQLLQGGWEPTYSGYEPDDLDQFVEGLWWTPTQDAALEQVVNNARALWRAHNGDEQ